MIGKTTATLKPHVRADDGAVTYATSPVESLEAEDSGLATDPCLDIAGSQLSNYR